MKRRSLAALAAVPAAALALTSCGGTGTPEVGGSTALAPALSPVAAVSQAAETTAEAGSAAFGLDLTVSVDGQSYTVTGQGAYDYDARAAEVTVDLPSGAGIPFDVGPLEAVVVDGAAYVNVPFLENGSWVRIDPAELADSGLLPEGSMELPKGDWGESLNPGSALDMLRGAGADATVVDEDVLVNGVSTTHYRGTIDLAAAAAELPEDQASRIPDLGDIPNPGYDIWVDSSDRIVRASLDVTVPAPPSAEVGSVTVNVMLNQSDFGKPVSVTAPPAEDVVSLSDMLGGLEGLGGLGGLEGLDFSQAGQLGLA